MPDIELIPADYAAVRLWRRRVHRIAWILGVLVFVTAGARAWLAWRITTERPLVERLKLEEKQAADRRTRLIALHSAKTASETQLESLQRLRDGAAWEMVFRAVDSAHSPKLWFESMEYQRELPAVAVAQLVASPGAAKPLLAKVEPALPRHRFEILGHALSHASITDFMQGLEQRPGISGVRLAETGLRTVSAGEVVDFRLAGLLAPQPKAAP